MKNSVCIAEMSLNLAMSAKVENVYSYNDIFGRSVMPRDYDLVIIGTFGKQERVKGLVISSYNGNNVINALTNIYMSATRAIIGAAKVDKDFNDIHGDYLNSEISRDMVKLFTRFAKNSRAIYRCFDGFLIPIFECDTTLNDACFVPRSTMIDKRSGDEKEPTTLFDKIVNGSIKFGTAKERGKARDIINATLTAIYDKAHNVGRVEDYIKTGTYDKMLTYAAADKYVIAYMENERAKRGISEAM